METIKGMGFSLLVLPFNLTLCEPVISIDLFIEDFFFSSSHKEYCEVMVSKL